MNHIDNHGYPVTHQSVAYTATAGTVAAAVGAQVNYVRIVCTTAAYISFTGTATSSDVYIPADLPEVFAIKPGQSPSAIQVSTGGTMHVTELTG